MSCLPLCFVLPFKKLIGLSHRLRNVNIAGYGRRPCHDRCHILRDESTESSTDESEDCHPHYHGSIPRLIITLDKENNQLQEDLSPETPGCPLELKCGSAPPRPIPVFTFTCEDFDELPPGSDASYDSHVPPDERPSEPTDERPEEPPAVPEPPAHYDQSSDSGEAAYLPPEMRPIDTKLTLELFNVRPKDNEIFRRRCTAVDECVSACECCRTPQPETQPIPFIDEPNFEPVIFENDCTRDKVTTPKVRRILPSLSIDKPEEKKKETADAICQTPSSPIQVEPKAPIPAPRKIDLNLDITKESLKIDGIQCRLKRALFNMSKARSIKSEETEVPSTYSTSESFDDTTNANLPRRTSARSPLETGTKRILDSVDRKSWKSPDEFRPSYGKVKALARHFNDINLKYSVRNYKRNCQSSPNLSGREKPLVISDNLHGSASIADIQFESNATDTSETGRGRMSDEEVKSILIQLEDWSKYGSRGSEDTLAQGNEFELPNLPAEEVADGGVAFAEIVERKPRRITLDNIRLKAGPPSSGSEKARAAREAVGRARRASWAAPRRSLPALAAGSPPHCKSTSPHA